jgi:hypothetical protein
MDPYNFVKLDPDQPQRKKLDPDPGWINIVTQAHAGTLEACNGAMEDLEAQKWAHTSI